MPNSFVYRRFSFLVAIALILGVLVAQSQQATPKSSLQLNTNSEKTFEIPCQELELCATGELKILPKRA